MSSVSVHFGLLAIAKHPAKADRTPLEVARDRVVSAGHRALAAEIVEDTETAVSERLSRCITDEQIDAVIIIGGASSQAVSLALTKLSSEPLPRGGIPTLVARGDAARCMDTFVFVLAGMVAHSVDRRILPLFDPATRPRNLVGDLARLKRLDAESVPVAITGERTQGGAGLPERLPAKPAARLAAERERSKPNAVPQTTERERTRPIGSGPHADGDRSKPERSKPASLAPMAAEQRAKAVVEKSAPASAVSSERKSSPHIVERSKPASVAPALMQTRTRAPSPPPVEKPVRHDDETANFAKLDAVGEATATGVIPAPPAAGSARSDTVVDDTSTEATATGVRPAPEPVARPDTTVDHVSADATATGIEPAPDDTATTSFAKPSSEENERPTVSDLDQHLPTLEPDEEAAVATASPASSNEQLPTLEPDEEPAAAAPAKPVTTPPPAKPITTPPPAPAKAKPNTTPPPTPTALKAIELPAPPTKRSPTIPPSPRTSDPDLPRGNFEYAIKKRGPHPALYVIGALVLLGLGFAGVLVLFGNKDKPAGSDTADVATVSLSDPPPPPPAPPPPAPVVAEPAPAEPASADPAPSAPPPTDPAPTTPVETVRTEPRRPTPTPGTGPITSPETGPTTTPDPGPTTKPETTPPPAPAVPEGCDERSCVMNNYDKPCCSRYKPHDNDLAPRIGGVPESLDKMMVRAGIEGVKPRVVKCGEETKVKGTVRVEMKVSPEGEVTAASLESAPDPTLGDCVVNAMRRAKFGKSINGGSFTYPFAF